MSPDDKSIDQQPEEKDETWPAVPQASSQEATRPARPKGLSERMKAQLAKDKPSNSAVETKETRQVAPAKGGDVDTDIRESRLIPVINRQTGTVGEDDPDDKMPTQPIVSAKLLVRQGSKPVQQPTNDAPPWTLQQFFNGEIDLDVELAKRFPNMPMVNQWIIFGGCICFWR